MLESSLDTVRDKESFIAFLGTFIADHEKNGANWENRTLNSFLQGMHGWLEDMDLDDFYKRIERTDVTRIQMNWRVFADVLMAAKIYE